MGIFYLKNNIMVTKVFRSDILNFDKAKVDSYTTDGNELIIIQVYDQNENRANLYFDRETAIEFANEITEFVNKIPY